MDRWDTRQTDHTWLQGKQFTKPNCLKTKHPVEEIQDKNLEQELQARHKLVALALGSQVPLRIDIERRILGQFHKLPGFQTTQPGLDTILGRDEEITFEDFLSPPEEREENVETDSLTVFERKLSLF
ncbi:hypothetical protein GpartN1_g6950.t1 [Galdieria partita]|uniref:Proteasome maturation factor UMP1 n=1 Tax=Galdieria partita TaxID=83374 RepID=A0A9C7UTE2_9RHOD|nr:hypothetical protein GpartN1_g6950.t1 [Galdieria partita]